MGFVIPVTVKLVPGEQTFSYLLDAEDRLRDYGWTSVRLDSGPAGKILSVEDRKIIFYLEGKTGATDGTAADDVVAALRNTGAWSRVIQSVAIKVAQLPKEAARQAGEAAGAAASGAVQGAGKPLTAVIGAVAVFGLLAAIGVAVFVAKRG